MNFKAIEAHTLDDFNEQCNEAISEGLSLLEFSIVILDVVREIEYDGSLGENFEVSKIYTAVFVNDKYISKMHDSAQE